MQPVFDLSPVKSGFQRHSRHNRSGFFLVPMALLIGLLSTGCAGAVVTPTVAPANQATTTISLQNITCVSCANASAGAAKAMPGVLSATVNKRAAELVVRYDRSRVGPADVAQTIKKAGYGAIVGGGKGSYKRHVTFDSTMDVMTLKHASPDLDVATLAVAGKVTVVDYFAEWCGPCRFVDREMYSQLLKHKNIVLRRFDIGDWDSPFALKQLAKVSTLPFVLVFGPDKKQIARIEGFRLEAMRAGIARGLKMAAEQK